MKVFHFLVPELVPLENKGEEAIVKGIGDVVFPNGNYEIHLFDEVDSYYFKDGIHVYPVKWFISPWLNHEFGLGFSYRKIRDSFQSIVRNGMHFFFPRWVAYRDRSLLATMAYLKSLSKGGKVKEKYLGLDNLLSLDFIIAGHDGAMDERVCHVISEFLGIFKLKMGLFGVEFPLAFKSKAIVSEQYAVLKNADFFYCRTGASKRVVDENFPSIKSVVKPDPAFGMKPSSQVDVTAYLNKMNLHHVFDKDVIVCTTCETGPISRFCFEGASSPGERIELHRKFYAEIIEHVIDNYDVNILFLPHALGPGSALNDVYVASEVIKRIKNKESVFLLDDNISAKMLKGIIGKSQFLIAERIHSMIGAVGVSTPFMCLGSKTDRRIKGIIEEMVGASSSVYYMNQPSINDAIGCFDRLWAERQDQADRLSNTFRCMVEQHDEVSRNINFSFGITDEKNSN